METSTTSQFLIAPDLSEAVELGGIPAGIYSARVTGVELRDTKDFSAKYLRWELAVFGAEGELSKYNNWKVRYNTMTSGKGAGMLKGFYKACKKEDFTGGAFDWSTLIGSEVQITLVQGKNQDGSPSDYPEVKAVKPIALPF